LSSSVGSVGFFAEGLSLPGKFQILFRAFLGFLYDPVKDDDLFVQDCQSGVENQASRIEFHPTGLR
jgi:hypothetical protein